ncbi:thiamine phosphate synthase [Mangrovivirga sp. M17]|uniref:Thiamine phosphate synthase n=1 Tax=Mangrovivirga halotolerans TaxID=2993936 RepID=A0ABT3RV51_9BACT|nr:thiamine phosphate synthase [Mangrovivirga halotolerans]MCX2745546.1 thiamine phosphate synthase [Mangrovivirga halotolerans]
MKAGSKIKVITPELSVKEELETVCCLLSLGIDIHLRKPGWSDDRMRAYLYKLPDKHLSQISVHGNWNLMEHGMGGLHLNSNQIICHKNDFRLSKSFHSIEAIENCNMELSYGFLSPVFDSISKKNYQTSFNKYDLTRKLMSMKKQMKIYALGGIKPENVKDCVHMGFDGIAVFGSIWGEPDLKTRMLQCEKFLAYA